MAAGLQQTLRLRGRSARAGLILALVAVASPMAASSAHAIEPFTDGSAALVNGSMTSGVALGITDMNNDGLDDIVRLDDTQFLEIEYQQLDGSFERYEFGEVGGSSWSLSLGDVNNDGYTDIFTGGAYNGLKVLTASADGTTFTSVTLETPPDSPGFPPPGVFLQCSNFVDIDNDGSLDVFACHDNGLSAPYSNDGTGEFTYAPGLISAVSTIPSDNSGNYGSIWSDYDNDGDLDLYIAKCSLGNNDPLSGRRTNLLFRNEGNGNWTEVAESAGLRPLAQSWSLDFGDIDNDGDFDAFLINHDQLSILYRNDGPGEAIGTFTEITASAGIAADLGSMGNGIQNHFEDFDNDGFIDLLVTGNDGQHRLFMNNGDLTFTRAVDPFPTGGLGIHSAVVGDLNNDGQMDVLAGFAFSYNSPSDNPDRLLLNPGNDNNWIAFRLHGDQSNRSAVGARIEITGPWGTQVREVRAGESYGISNTLMRHFGLGSVEAIDTVTISWPSGQVDTFDYAAVNTVHDVMEGCPETFYADGDGDGFGDARITAEGCVAPEGYVVLGTDCDDADENNFPGNPEVCDTADNNCNGEADEDVECSGTSSGGG
ncbi:MAG: VCBS repeat-containing protein [Nannocystaceae bacterium]|nr:VCBS repeat-containing protein [Nannocystaceae bacterium]